MTCRRVAAVVALVLLGGTIVACDRETGSVREVLRYVALGDSYTIGTSVSEAERWPDQVVARLAALDHELGSSDGRFGLELLANLGVNGFTSADLIGVELPQLDALRPEFMTLLIGVNDVVQGVPDATYRRNVERILDDIVRRVGSGRVLVVTTPDYTVTPAGASFGDPAQQAAGIRANNAILITAAEARGLRVVDIYEVSQGAATDRALVASDGLHPSGQQYGLWVDRILPAVEELLTR
ncbi:MAG TPA: SGNH/GDSL hydrolase family protein [Candidatus Eisenbacteria bacterium]|nr:SGNH/GDSL hydrolase family protein [Candidatus Eisenbacteria bacterium]